MNSSMLLGSSGMNNTSMLGLGGGPNRGSMAGAYGIGSLNRGSMAGANMFNLLNNSVVDERGNVNNMSVMNMSVNQQRTQPDASFLQRAPTRRPGMAGGVSMSGFLDDSVLQGGLGLETVSSGIQQ